MLATIISKPYLYFDYDVESGKYNLRIRPFSPSSGRFLSPDPIGFLGGDPSLYRYVFNNPVNNIDPFGYFSLRRVLNAIALGTFGWS